MFEKIKNLFKSLSPDPSPKGSGVDTDAAATSPSGDEREASSLAEALGERLPAITPEPTDAELAAQALLESLCEVNRRNEAKKADKDGKRIADADTHGSRITNPSEPTKDAGYYHTLADKIRTARAEERRATMRLLAACEEQLESPQLYIGQYADLERQLYRRQDCAYREGGELLSRWQHCLAMIIVKLMNAPGEEIEAAEDGHTESTESTEKQADGEGGGNAGGND